MTAPITTQTQIEREDYRFGFDFLDLVIEWIDQNLRPCDVYTQEHLENYMRSIGWAPVDELEGEEL